MVARGGVDRAAVHVGQTERDDRRSLVDGPAPPIHDPAQHPRRDTQAERLAGQADPGGPEGKTGRALVDLDDDHVRPELDDPAVSPDRVRSADLDLLAEGDPRDPPDDQERTAEALDP